VEYRAPSIPEGVCNVRDFQLLRGILNGTIAVVKIISKHPRETVLIGKMLGQIMRKGDILCLQGHLGSGKTYFTKGVCDGLGVRDLVASPTYTIVNTYSGRLPVYHMDLYRIETVREIEDIGYEEFLYHNGVTIIEWAEKLENLLPEEYFSLLFSYCGPESRYIYADSVGDTHKRLTLRIRDSLFFNES
jgi:tRNA threonylcarbamoyladenosine biosynthesis protein TsaE